MDIRNLYNLYTDCGLVCTDSRNIINGSIFFALKGENFNGNKFAMKALDGGCVYAVVDEPIGIEDKRIIQVPDVLTTLQKLANFHRKRFSIPVLAITGTNGKTTSKELINAVLSKELVVTATKGNLNNHIGVPLTLLDINDSTQVAIIEMGANHVGEIAMLCEIAEPNIGLITNIGNAHLEGFGSPANVVKAKSELYNYIRINKGVIFVNSDNDLLTSLSDGIETVRYGKEQSSDCVGNPSGEIFASVEWSTEDTNKPWIASTKLIGDYNFTNIMAAICIGQHFGLDEEVIIEALSSYEPGLNRSQYIESGKNRIILDAYNANPDSMSAALRNFGSIKTQNKVAILGDMFELGEFSIKAHQRVIAELKEAGVDNVYLVGPEFAKASEKEFVNVFLSIQQFKDEIIKHPVSNSLILLKGSRAMRMEQLLDLL